jgi:hypothetical protein
MDGRADERAKGVKQGRASGTYGGRAASSKSNILGVEQVEHMGVEQGRARRAGSSVSSTSSTSSRVEHMGGRAGSSTSSRVEQVEHGRAYGGSSRVQHVQQGRASRASRAYGGRAGSSTSSRVKHVEQGRACRARRARRAGSSIWGVEQGRARRAGSSKSSIWGVDRINTNNSNSHRQFASIAPWPIDSQRSVVGPQGLDIMVFYESKRLAESALMIGLMVLSIASNSHRHRSGNSPLHPPHPSNFEEASSDLRGLI